uniref:PilZ domain-containing protein n=1 Tax=uncultured organism TaxID=155900 RepID=E3T321_9ZZZZ|nr:hypothetical protein [uncultured organism]
MVTQAQCEIQKPGNADDFTINRWDRRITANLEVALYRSLVAEAADAGLLGIFRTRDLDNRGMFLETGKLTLHTNEIVFIHVEIAIKGQVKKYWLRGIVVRRNDCGLGIRYSDTQSNAFTRDLQALQD